MNPIEVVAFDCDGVLFDTQEGNRAYYNFILEHFNRPAMTPGELQYVHTHTVHQAIDRLFEDEVLRQAARDFRKTIDYGRFLKYLKMEPHLVGLLDRLRGRCKTAIATNRTDTMNRLLHEFGLAERFDLVVTCLDVERPKPFPDPLLKILSHFRIEPHQALFVGDSEVDAETARSAAVPFVAYRNSTLPARHHIESLRELDAVLAV
jgi:HAD superfamily hydrolase (TIGR01509 family)